MISSNTKLHVELHMGDRVTALQTQFKRLGSMVSMTEGAQNR